MSSPVAAVALYSLVIVAGALAGAAVPLLTREGRWRTTFLAFAAGVMLGAAFFHMLPEAYHEGGGWAAFALVPFGFLLMLLVERSVPSHACEEPPDCPEHGRAHGHALGLASFLGLSVHTLFDGVALGSATMQGVGGVAALAITAHKIPSSLSLAAILRAEGRRPTTVLWMCALYGLMVPVGAALYGLLDAAVHFASLASWALAFSAGTFLYIAVSDLLPHVNRHGKDRRVVNVLALALGLGVMLLLARLLGHAD